MRRDWSVGRKLAAGFGVSVALTVLVVGIGIHALGDVSKAKNNVIEVDTRVLLLAEHLENLSEARTSAARGHLLTREQHYLDEYAATTTELRRTRGDLERLAPRLRTELAEVERSAALYEQRLGELFEAAGTATPEQLEKRFVNDVRPARRQLAAAVEEVVKRQTAFSNEAIRAASRSEERATALLVGIGVVAALFSVLVSFLLARTLGRQIGSAVSQVRSSSAELQAAATQQASGTKEQATAMTEISTTISELLATSRQIAESAQQVARMAQQATESARSGTMTAKNTSDAMTSIHRQVQQVVGHMLDLGRKSQQIGTVLDIVSELAEQTNILAINATIEASGAGEAGRRFGVVADEIRKLADRVSGSTKEIRELIEEVRGAVNTTIMATETGSKAAEGGTRQFHELNTSFEKIVSLVGTTNEAAREIELSTKQQATAVEQVKVAINGAAQATKEAEASSSQTSSTATQLANLSEDLLRLVRPEAVR